MFWGAVIFFTIILVSTFAFKTWTFHRTLCHVWHWKDVFVTKLADSHDFVVCVIDQVKLKQKYNSLIVFKNITCRLEWLSFCCFNISNNFLLASNSPWTFLVNFSDWNLNLLFLPLDGLKHSQSFFCSLLRFARESWHEFLELVCTKSL